MGRGQTAQRWRSAQLDDCEGAMAGSLEHFSVEKRIACDLVFPDLNDNINFTTSDNRPFFCARRLREI